MAYVAVDGDSAEERHIGLTSIQPLKEHPNSSNSNTNNNKKNHINVQHAELRQLFTNVTTLIYGLNEICAKLEAIDLN